MRIYVVTKVPPLNDSGNLACAGGHVFLDPQAKGGRYDDPHETIGKALGKPVLDMYVLCPNFRLGEIIALDGSDRDQFTRKPSKWDIEITELDSFEEAAECAFQVCREELEKELTQAR